MKEVWKDIPHYEGFYKVSNLGRVYGIKRDNILKQSTKWNGRKGVVLSKYGIRKDELVHRLVAMAFIPNPNNLPQVNHKDENPANNCVDNLEWCTAKYNSNYGSLPEKKKTYRAKRIRQYTLDGVFIKEYPSAAEAIKAITTSAGTHIRECARGERKSAYGYKWEYVKEEPTNEG